MCQNHDESFAAQLERTRLQIKGPAVVRKLEEQIVPVAGETEACEVVRVQQSELVERDLAAREHIELYALGDECFAKLGNTLLHLGDFSRVVVAYVRGRSHRSNAVGDSCTCHGDTLFKRSRPVVEPRKYVRVEIDHRPGPPYALQVRARRRRRSRWTKKTGGNDGGPGKSPALALHFSAVPSSSLQL